jgi:hypothetical protein
MLSTSVLFFKILIHAGSINMYSATIPQLYDRLEQQAVPRWRAGDFTSDLGCDWKTFSLQCGLFNDAFSSPDFCVERLDD